MITDTDWGHVQFSINVNCMSLYTCASQSCVEFIDNENTVKCGTYSCKDRETFDSVVTVEFVRSESMSLMLFLMRQMSNREDKG